MTSNKLRLHCPILLLCERKEIAEFLGAYMRFLFKQGINLPNLQLINLGGAGELSKFLQYAEQNEEVETLQKIRYFAEAGVGVRQKQQELQTIKNNSFLKDFKDYDYYLFPGKQASGYWSKGYLEDVLVKVLEPATSEGADFANLCNVSLDYLLSVNSCRGYRAHLSNPNRHMLHAYFAGTERYVGLSVGEAAKAGAFNMDAKEFAGLRELLTRL